MIELCRWHGGQVHKKGLTFVFRLGLGGCRDGLNLWFGTSLLARSMNYSHGRTKNLIKVVTLDESGGLPKKQSECMEETKYGRGN